jgi:hypothetical protein
MRKRADNEGVDLLLVDTGDRVEGNGLYDSSTPKGLFTYDIFREQHIDLLSTGNHELYQADTADREHKYTVPNFKDNYIASNLDYINTKTGEREPMAPRYRKLRTKNQGIEIVAFGFLFDFTLNANNTVVQPVGDTIKEEWFMNAIREKADLFVVIGHVGLRMPEFKKIYTAIRKQNWYTPIVFFGGHAHVRDAVKYDSSSIAMASGRYFETIGWMSMDGVKAKAGALFPARSVSFFRKYIDNNLFGLYHHSGLNETTFPTTIGKRVSSMITRARKVLDLDYTFGCAPRDLWTNRAPYPSEDSVFTWIETEALPDIVVNKERKDIPRLAIVNTGGVRFDIFKGPFTRDSTYIVSPFVSGLKYIPDIPYAVAKRVIGLLNSAGPIFAAEGLNTSLINLPEQMIPQRQSEIGRGGDIPQSKPRLELRNAVEEQWPLGRDNAASELIGGYTTKDDLGDDGDDTIHSPLEFYSVPNCIQAQIGWPGDGEPETVDLVFIDFIQPFIIIALKFSGGDYTERDVKRYIEGSFTYHMAEWIKKNWAANCET